jgi:lipopolysaccharide/colanic/teichoic acid biosynthesis glycosyltransferase
MPLQAARFVKAVMDRVVAAALLLLFSPLMLLIAAAIWWHLGEPILFRQVRPGLNGRPFTILKFRTLVGEDVPGGNDNGRLTGLGRFLRATGLDELPELLNVLKGEMSFVGPRPLLVDYLDLYSTRQARRHEVRPGITGLARVNGGGELKWERRFRYDVWYIDHWSLWLDLKILFLSAARFLSLAGAHHGGLSDLPAFQGAVAQGAPSGQPVRRAPPILRLSFRASAVATLAAAAIAAFVALVDPYGITGLVQIPGVNTQKTHRVDNGGRVARSIALWRSDHDIVILGGTRTWAGIDPESPILARRDAYNAALRDATVPELVAVGRFLLDEDPPRRVIIGISFSMFEADRAHVGDFEKSGFDGDRMPLVLLRSFVSPEAVKDSLKTLKANLTGAQSCDHDNGLHLCPPGEAAPVANFNEALARSYLVQPWHYADFDYDPRRVEQLGRIARELAAAGVEVDIFTAPVHAHQMEAVRAAGLYPVHERWLTDLTLAIADANDHPASRAPIRLWDFTGYSSITTEPVPRGSPDGQMQWYRNSSIFTPLLGEVVMRRILADDPGRHPDFGVRLEPANLGLVLMAKRQGRERYAAAHPDEVAQIQSLARHSRERVGVASLGGG